MSHHEDNELSSVQKEAETYLRDYCGRGFERWSKYLEIADIENGFVDLQLRIMNYSDPSRIIHVENYETLFEDKTKSEKRRTVIVSGDHGSGKSTYLCKLALDWANGDSYLRQTFDLVLYYDFSSWKMAAKRGMAHVFSPQLQPFATNLIETSAKVLIICDNCMEVPDPDELNRNQAILKHETYPNVTVMATVQSLDFWDICREFVWVEGFNESATLDYMKIQNCQPNDNELLADLVQLPLACALYCTLQRAGCSTETAADMFDLIKCYVEHTLGKCFELSGIHSTEQTVKETLMMIGKYSLVHLVDRPKFEELNDFKLVLCENPFDSESLYGCNFGNFDLLTKSKTGEKYDMVHQSVADYLAAYYIANILNLELNLPAKNYLWFKTWLGECVLYHVLFLWEEGHFADKSVNTLLAEGETCLPWFSKRPSAFQHLSNQSHSVETIAMFWNLSFGKSVNCFKTLAVCQNLRRIVLDACNLAPQTARVFADVLNSDALPKLVEILINDDLTVGKEVCVFEALGKRKNLSYLQLLACHPTSESVAAFSNQVNLGNLPNIESLVLPGSIEFGKHPELFSSIAKCPNLRTLHFGRCDVTPESIRSFVDGIKTNSFSNLDELDFSGCKQIGDIRELFSSLGNLKNLRLLDLTECDLSSTCLRALADMMNESKFANLENFYISSNENVGKEMSFINALCFCKNLKYLVIFKCNLPPESVDVLNVLRSRECEVIDTDVGML